MPAGGPDKDQIDGIIRRLKHSLSEGDVEAFSNRLFVELSNDLLVAVREQKLLLRSGAHAREMVAETLRNAARTCLSGPDLEGYCRYIDFCLVLDSARQRRHADAKALLAKMPRVSVAELISIGKKINDSISSSVSLNLQEEQSNSSIAHNERQLHELNGYLNDVAYAVARAVNETAKVALGKIGRLQPTARDRAITLFRDLVYIASEINSLDWILDCVTYGDFSVSDISQSEPFEITLEYTDPRRSLIRTLGIRRELVLNYFGHRHRRVLRDKLMEAQWAVLNLSLRHYQSETREVILEEKDFDRIRKASEQILTSVEADDDLLLLASDADRAVLEHYHVAMALRWFTIGAQAVQKKLPPKLGKTLSPPAIPLSLLSSIIRSEDQMGRANSTLEALTSQLPTGRHFDLLRRPFVLDDKEVVRPVLSGDPGVWNVAVRETFIEGGKLGKRYGAIWEEFYADTFKDTGWSLLRRGQKLRLNGEIITDVDMLLLRDDLLLTVQVKALTGSSLSIYDHWKNRQTIEWGCEQARTASDFLSQNKSMIASIANKHIMNNVRYIEPVVLTNLGYFDGWVVKGVPVIGEVGRKAITIGSKVEYVHSVTKEVVRTDHYVREEQLTTQKIISLLKDPIELRIAPEQLEVQHSCDKVAGLTFRRPEFVVPMQNSNPTAQE